MYDLVSSKLIYGVSTRDKCIDTENFIKFFDKCGVMNCAYDNLSKLSLDCFKHDVIGNMISGEHEPVYIMGVALGTSITDVCHIDLATLHYAKEIFDKCLKEFNDYMNNQESDYKIYLQPKLILFGEGFTQNGQ